MDIISSTPKEILHWIRFVLNPETEMPVVTDWPALLAFAEKQSLIGILLPERCPESLSKEILLEWIGEAQLVEQQNKLLNQRVGQLFRMFEQDGFRCCLLKGQGNASLYPNPLRRCPGDIDIWIDADEKTVYQYVKKKFPEEKASYKHIHFPIFEDVPVDIHYTPLKLYHPTYNKRLQRWIEENKEEQMSHHVRLANMNSDIAIPVPAFNAVYQLGHMMIHLFDEGVGLRQVVDYYFVLTRLDVTEKERRELVGTVEDLGMLRFAKGIMWIEHEVLGLPIEKCLVDPEEKRGVQLLNDILEGGNFGHYSNRQEYSRYGRFAKKIVDAWHLVKFSTCFPGDAIFRLLSKMKNGVKILAKRKT